MGTGGLEGRPATEVRIFEFNDSADLRAFVDTGSAGARPTWLERPPIPPRSLRTPVRCAEAKTSPYNRHIIWVADGELILGSFEIEFKDQAAYTATSWDTIRNQWASNA